MQEGIEGIPSCVFGFVRLWVGFPLDGCGGDMKKEKIPLDT